MPKYNAIVFDRDGTLNASSKNEGGYTLSVEEMELLPYVKEALTYLKKQDVRLFVFTQQRCIGKGLLTEETLVKINNRMNELLEEEASIEVFYHCPHLIEDHCDCSKPKPGMLYQCIKEQSLEPQKTLVVGDMFRDGEAAKAAGLDFAFVHNDLGKTTKEEYEATGLPYFKNLMELIQSDILK